MFRGRELTPLSALISRFGSATIIKSVQRGSLLPGASASASVALSAGTNMDNCIVIQTGYNGGFLDPSVREARLTMNATHVIVTKGDTTDSGVRVGYAVLEFMPGVINRVGTGTITIANNATTGTATIPKVNIDKTIAFWTGQSHNTAGTQGATYWACRIEITNETTITAYRNGFTADQKPTVGYSYIEFF